MRYVCWKSILCGPSLRQGEESQSGYIWEILISLLSAALFPSKEVQGEKGERIKIKVEE